MHNAVKHEVETWTTLQQNESMKGCDPAKRSGFCSMSHKNINLAGTFMSKDAREAQETLTRANIPSMTNELKQLFLCLQGFLFVCTVLHEISNVLDTGLDKVRRHARSPVDLAFLATARILDRS